MKRIFAIFIICLFTIGFVLISGCASAEKDIVNAKSLMDSGTSKNNNINVKGDETNSALLKDKMDSAKSDFQQALTILNAAKTDSDEEKQMISRYKIICEGSIQYLDARKTFSDALAHSEKEFNYLDAEDYSSAKTELAQTQKYTKNAIDGYKKAQTTFSGIPCPLTPSIDYRIKSLGSFTKLLDGINYLISGLEKLSEAQSIVATDQTAAKNNLLDAKTDFQQAKEIFDKLKSDEDSQTSASAISAADESQKMIEKIDSILLLFPAQ